VIRKKSILIIEMDKYELLSTASLQGVIPVEKYRSKSTGVTVCIAQVEGPIVSGYICVATEAHDDDGLPHTLEHLVFMGSEEYPYKGMLDQFANRCLACGTNAWTDTDHTCYTMETAGSEGFLTLLPIYMDHLLYPTLTEAGYVTEVHHVNGEGENAGVVYCEMQARENTEHSRCYLEFLRSMYPGKCGYKSETGGIMKNLRTTCSHKKVVDYHQEFYRPDNLCIIITGVVKAEDVFKALIPFEEKIKSKPELPAYVRPWMNSVPPLEKDVDEKHIKFATDDESTGMVMIGWRGNHVNDRYTSTALQILFSSYLTESSIAPLQQELVEIDEPFCGDLSVNFFENLQTALCLSAEGVPKEKLFQIKDKIVEVILRIAEHREAIDMDRMRTLVNRSILEEMNNFEDNPHDALAMLSIGDYLYTDNDKELQQNIDKISRLKKLKEESEDFWVGLLNKYIKNQKMVVIVAEPSEEFMQKSGEEEKNRVKEQAEQFGDKGLKEMKEVLEKAMAENEIDPPSEIISKVAVPSTDSITFHNIQSKSNQHVQQNSSTDILESFPLDNLPCPFYIHDVKSFFTQIHVILDCSNIADNLRMYIPLYTEILFESPILKNGVVIPYEEVVKQLAADTLSTSASLGINGGRFSAGSFSKLIHLSFTVENEKYNKAVEWIQDVLFNLQFSAERLKIVANKIINDVANYKRSGRSIVSALMHNISFSKASNTYIVNMIRQHDFLSQMIKDLDSNQDKVMSGMERLRSSLLLRENYRFYIAGSLSNLPKEPRKIWEDTIFKDMPRELIKASKVPFDGEFLSGNCNAQIVGVGSVESAFLLRTCQGIDSYEHPDYPALLVYVQYLCALEGPLWRQIRGAGLSYNYRIQLSPLTGKIIFALFKSTHICNAYKKAKEIMLDYLSGKSVFEYSQVEAARSIAIFQNIEGEKVVSDAVMQNISAEFKRIPTTFSRDLLKKISAVTVDELKRVGEQYFSKLFDNNNTTMAICCHPTKVEEIVESFKTIDVNLETISSLEDVFSK